jgi:hypothetical protein
MTIDPSRYHEICRDVLLKLVFKRGVPEWFNLELALEHMVKKFERYFPLFLKDMEEDLQGEPIDSYEFHEEVQSIFPCRIAESEAYYFDLTPYHT